MESFYSYYGDYVKGKVEGETLFINHQRGRDRASIYGWETDNHKSEAIEDMKKYVDHMLNNVLPGLIARIASQVAVDVCEEAMGGVFQGLQRDVETVANVSIQDFGAILTDKRFTSFVSDAIMQEVKKNLKGIKIK